MLGAYQLLRKNRDEDDATKIEKKKGAQEEEKNHNHHERREEEVDLNDYRFEKLKRLCDQKSDTWDFRGYGMTQEDGLNLGVLISETKDLEYLHISKNSLTDLGMVQILLALKQHRHSLQGLTLGGNDLTPGGGIQAIIDALPTFTVLEYLCFDRFAELLPKFGKAMRRVALLDQLKELEFKNNSLEDSHFHVLERYLRSSHCHIKILSFYEETHMTCQGLQSLTRGLKYSYKLRLLTLSHLRLSLEHMKVLSEYLADGCCLDMLELSHNSLGDAHLISIAPSLLQNKVMTTIDLASNHITKDVIARIDTELYLREQLDTPVILTVIIRDNRITEEELEQNIAGFHDLTKTRFVFRMKDDSTTSGTASTDP